LEPEDLEAIALIYD